MSKYIAIYSFKVNKAIFFKPCRATSYIVYPVWLISCVCVDIYRAYGIDKVDKGPKEVLNPEIQKVNLIIKLVLLGVGIYFLSYLALLFCLK